VPTPPAPVPACSVYRFFALLEPPLLDDFEDDPDDVLPDERAGGREELLRDELLLLTVLLLELDDWDGLLLFLTEEPDLDDDDRFDEELEREASLLDPDVVFRRVVFLFTVPDDLRAFEELSVVPLRLSRLLSFTESSLRR
jgi:hypothetical protein